MTRDEAIETVRQLLYAPVTKQAHAEMFVDGLAALGILKCEEPETPADVIGDIVLHKQNFGREDKWEIGKSGAKHILLCLELAGFEIAVRTTRRM